MSRKIVSASKFAMLLAGITIQIRLSAEFDLSYLAAPIDKVEFVKLPEKQMSSHIREKRCIVVQKQSGTHGDSNEGDADDEEYPDYSIKRKPAIKNNLPKKRSSGVFKPKKFDTVEVQDDSYDVLDYPVISSRSRTQKYSSNGNKHINRAKRPGRNRKTQRTTTRSPLEQNENNLLYSSNDTNVNHIDYATPS